MITGCHKALWSSGTCSSAAHTTQLRALWRCPAGSAACIVAPPAAPGQHWRCIRAAPARSRAPILEPNRQPSWVRGKTRGEGQPGSLLSRWVWVGSLQLLAGWVGSWVGSWSAPQHLGHDPGPAEDDWILAAGSGDLHAAARSSQLGSARLTRLVRAGLLVGLGWFVTSCPFVCRSWARATLCLGMTT